MKRAMGYLAFPPGGSPYLADDVATLSSAQEDEQQQEERARQRGEEELEREAAWTARVQRDAELRQQQLGKEEAEARRGEEEWVRSGGILRDGQGKRDIVRTQAVRDELKLRDIEKALVEMWEAYEEGWKELLGKRERVRFCDVPWPVDTGDKRVEVGDLRMEKVEEFLLGGLRVRGCNVTRKDRIRSSLLRWHPDKMTSILARVVEEDLGMVKEGISAVIRCLQKLNSKEYTRLIPQFDM